MARNKAESTNRLSVYFLKRHGYLSQQESSRYGGIRWTRGEWENNINFWIVTSKPENESQETSYAKLIYTITHNNTGEKVNMSYKVPLVTTPCNYGGRRYWFKCILIKNGKYCGKRVGVIYNVGNYFGCRYCAEIAYQAQFEGGRFRVTVTEPDVEKALEEAKTKYYNGKPTRKYRRYLRLSDKMDASWMRMLVKFGKRL